MKKIISSLLLLGFVQESNSQVYLGFTLKEVLGHMDMTKNVITRRDVYQKGVVCLEVVYKSEEESQYVRRYIFSAETGLCYIYILEPKDRAALTAFVNYANKHYVAKGLRRWITYQNQHTVSVDLLYDEIISQSFFYFRILDKEDE